MANIPLRTYIREIEVLVEQGYHDQAIAHCKHILITYPKHIDSYRLLGKAYLESQRYGDASDIFQRVLSSVPEDFVSHVGMSIIREDEGNFNEAIWHMERAFEMQPANNAVQSELKRLYGRRDGTEPPKINLTRGALARMYLKGSLYQQAIAELRISLAEDPQRLDLQSLLARAYYQSGLKVEAAETCNALLTKLPYCMDANLILADILVENKRPEEAQVCRARLSALNPYATHLTDNNSNPDQVSEGAVMIEKLEAKQGQDLLSTPEQPEWATSLGVEVKGEDNGASIPDWLSASPVDAMGELTPKEIPMPTDLGAGPLETGEQPEAIPEWMKEAGWEQPENSTIETTSQFEAEEANISGESLARAEIPEWLKSLAPEETKQAEQFPISDVGETAPESIPWLEKTPPVPTPTDSIGTWLNELSADDVTKLDITPKPSVEGKPERYEKLSNKTEIERDYIDTNKPVETGDILGQPAHLEPSEITEAPKDSSIPDWLMGLDTETPPTEEAKELPEVTGHIDEVQPTEPQSKQPPEIIPEWLQETPKTIEPAQVKESELISDVRGEKIIEEPPAGDEDTKPVRITQKESEQIKKDEFEPLSDRDSDAAFAWLENLAAKQGVQETYPSKPEERLEEPPEWIREIGTIEENKPENEIQAEEIPSRQSLGSSEEHIATAIDLPIMEEKIVPNSPEGEGVEKPLPDWLGPEKETPSEAILQPQVEAELPDWLQKPIEEQPPAAEELPGTELPEWLLEETGIEKLSEPVEPLPSIIADEQLTESEAAESIPEADKLPDWLAEVTEEAITTTSEQQMVSTSQEVVEVTPPEAHEEIITTPLEQEVTASKELVSETPITEVIETTPAETIIEPKETPIVEREVILQPEPISVAEAVPVKKVEPFQPENEFEQLLLKARGAITSGKNDEAGIFYTNLIKNKKFLAEIIKDLDEGLYRYPMDISLWICLGDAYMYADQLQSALDAYTKAEELLR